MSSPRQPYLPTTEVDKRKLQLLYEHFLEQTTGNDCWEVEHLMVPGVYARSDYPSTKIMVDGARKDQRLSRLFYALYVGQLPTDLIVRHTCDNTKCVRPAHLMAGTGQDNADDKRIRNRAKGINAGEGNSNSKLTTDVVMKTVLPLLAANEKIKEIARIVGVTPTQISYIKNGHSWSETTGIEPKPKSSRQERKQRRGYDRDKTFTDEFLVAFRSSLNVTEKVISDDVTTPCHLFVGGEHRDMFGRITIDGYGAARWEGAYRLAHHISFRIAHGRWPKPNYDISHQCRNKLCANPDHLDELTRQEHMFYAAERGWLSQGHTGQRNNQRLTDEQIRQIKEHHRDRPTDTDRTIRDRLAPDVTEACIADIRKGNTGTHVQVNGFVPRRPREKQLFEADGERVKQLFADGATLKQIAKLYTCSPGSIRHYLVSEGVEMRAKSYRTAVLEALTLSPMESKIKQLFHEGKEQEEMVTILNLNSRKPVTRILKKLGLSCRDRNRAKRDAAEPQVLALFEGNKSLVEIIQETGITSKQVIAVLAKHNLSLRSRNNVAAESS